MFQKLLESPNRGIQISKSTSDREFTSWTYFVKPVCPRWQSSSRRKFLFLFGFDEDVVSPLRQLRICFNNFSTKLLNVKETCSNVTSRVFNLIWLIIQRIYALTSLMNDVTRILTRIRFDVVNESRHLRILFVVYHKKLIFCSKKYSLNQLKRWWKQFLKKGSSPI